MSEKEETEESTSTVTTETTPEPEPAVTVEAPKETTEEKAAGEEEIEVVEERIYTIPLRHVHVVTPRGRRAPRSVRDVRAYIARHMRSEEVSISNEVNELLW
ncbi:MAG TPA: hypothetical protein VEH56_01595, partial [Candidatus Saccharimonadales bacterium]|nr:hypothetical protein [Candidatus Saccharimonadales bacterium]